MIYSYDKVYLRIAQRVLGEMLNYAVYDIGPDGCWHIING